MLTVRIQEKNHSESIMVLKLKDGKKTERSESSGERKKELLYIFMPFNFWMNKVSAVGAGIERKERKVLT